MVQHGFGTLSLKTIKSWTKTFENKFPQQTFWVKVKKKNLKKKKRIPPTAKPTDIYQKIRHLYSAHLSAYIHVSPDLVF